MTTSLDTLTGALHYRSIRGIPNAALINVSPLANGKAANDTGNERTIRKITYYKRKRSINCYGVTTRPVLLVGAHLADFGAYFASGVHSES
jgi:hypothetical protein